MEAWSQCLRKAKNGRTAPGSHWSGELNGSSKKGTRGAESNQEADNGVQETEQWGVYYKGMTSLKAKGFALLC